MWRTNSDLKEVPVIRILNKFEPNPYSGIEVDTTSRGGFKDLSPFFLGPYTWCERGTTRRATIMENLWQYSKVYPEHVGADGYPNEQWYLWNHQGLNNQVACRYPLGKGRKPVYTWWKGEQLDYIAARKKLYIPAYTELVLQTKSYALLYKWVMEGRSIVLRDFDGYNHLRLGISLEDVINNPKKPLGHAFIIYGLLTGKINDKD